MRFKQAGREMRVQGPSSKPWAWSLVLQGQQQRGAFADWGQVFAGDSIMASAALDRLLHRSTVINIRGDSYRLKEKRIANASAVTAEALPLT